MYNFILNPKTNKKVSILSYNGIKVINNYLKMIGGSESKLNNQQLTPDVINFYQNLYEDLYNIVYSNNLHKFLPTLYQIIPKNYLQGNFYRDIEYFDHNRYQVLYRTIINSMNYYKPSDQNNQLQVYNRGFYYLKYIPKEKVKIYAEMRDIPVIENLTQEKIRSIQKKVDEEMLSPEDIAIQTIFYQELSNISKKMFEMQKRTPEYLYFFRNTFDEMGNRLNLTETFNTNAVTNGLQQDMISFNMLVNIYHYIPPLMDSCCVYRCETLWEGNKKLLSNYYDSSINQYIFNGVTSTSADPRVGYSFNKVFNSPDEEKIVFKIHLPKGTKVIVPSVRSYEPNIIASQLLDSEFEILLFNRAKIRIISIEKQKTINFYPSETLDPNEFNLNEPMKKTFGYFITAEFMGYDMFN